VESSQAGTTFTVLLPQQCSTNPEVAEMPERQTEGILD